MAGTTLRTGMNTFPVSIAGGSIPDANRIIDVSTWAAALEPRKTPVLTKIYKSDPILQRPFYFGQSRRVAQNTTLAGAHIAGATTLNVASGSGVIVQKYHLLDISNYVAGSTTVLDPTRREIVWVSAEPVADALTVVRGMSGTTAIAHDANALVTMIGTAEPELQFHTISPFTQGFQYYNYVQRFEGGVKADMAAQNMPTWEDRNNPMIRNFEETQKTKKLELEMAFWRGGRQAGDPSTPLPATMGGIDTFLTTNIYNLGGSRLTPRLLESSLRDLAKTTDGGPEGIQLLMSYNTAAIFDSLLDPIRMATASDNKISFGVDQVKFRFGVFDIMVSHNCFDGVVYGVRMDQLAIRPFKGLDWHVSEIAGAVNGADHDQKFISGDFSLVVESEQSMFKLYNFSGNLDDYPSPWAA